MCKRFFPIWLVLSLIWSGVVFYFCWANWPYMPLDLSGVDPAAVEALRSAILRHSLFYGALAAVPPAIAFVFGRMMCRGRTDTA